MAARIEVEHLAGDEFRVTVSEGGRRTVHTVTVARPYARRLAGDGVAREDLVRHSFEFLLEHEPKESILGSFDLPVIARYFPGYEPEINRRVRGK